MCQITSVAEALEAEKKFCECKCCKENQNHNARDADGDGVVPVFKSFADYVGECEHDD